LHKHSANRHAGNRKGWFFVLIVVLAVFSPLIWRITHNQAPTLQLTRPLKGIGNHTPVDFEVRDSRTRLSESKLNCVRGDRRFVVMDINIPDAAW